MYCVAVQSGVGVNDCQRPVRSSSTACFKEGLGLCFNLG